MQPVCFYANSKPELEKFLKYGRMLRYVWQLDSYLAFGSHKGLFETISEDGKLEFDLCLLSYFRIGEFEIGKPEIAYSILCYLIII